MTGSDTSQSRPDAIAMLTADHAELRRLFRDFESARDDAEVCVAIAALACAELGFHATLEHEIFYPAARAHLDLHDQRLVDEAEAAHRAANALVEQLKTLAPRDPSYAGTFAVLGECVDRHLTMEEEEIFPRIRTGTLDLDAIAADMRRRKEVLLGSAATPGQAEPSLEAEGREEPTAAEALARQWTTDGG